MRVEESLLLCLNSKLCLQLFKYLFSNIIKEIVTSHAIKIVMMRVIQDNLIFKAKLPFQYQATFLTYYIDTTILFLVSRNKAWYAKRNLMNSFFLVIKFTSSHF